MLRIRHGTVEDVRLLRTMILEFAEFEKIAEYVTITEESIARDGFGEHPRFHTLMAEWNGEAAGYAIHFDFYSSFAGPGMFLEDVFVRESFRGKGIGKALMAEVAATALRKGFPMMRWEVLDWNRTAIDFYRGMGALLLEEWKAVQIEGEPLHRLASKAIFTITSNERDNRMKS
jgi:GNAT superfamily N-acetyltransferase